MTDPARYLLGDVIPALRRLPSNSIDVSLTSIPYWGRARYMPGDDREIGTEPLHRYVSKIADVFDEVARLLRPPRPLTIDELAEEPAGPVDVEKRVAGGLVWLNVGDTSVGSGGAGGDHRPGEGRANKATYRQAEATVWALDEGTFGGSRLATLPPGGWAGVPHRIAAELQLRGWLLRSSIVWAKPNPKREDVRHVRRPKEQHETILLLSRCCAGETRFASDDQKLGDVWEIPTATGNEKGGKAPWPVALPEKMLGLSGPAGVVLDPFAGAGNSAIAAARCGWDFVGVDLDPSQVTLAAGRTPIVVERVADLPVDDAARPVR